MAEFTDLSGEDQNFFQVELEPCVKKKSAQVTLTPSPNAAIAGAPKYETGSMVSVEWKGLFGGKKLFVCGMGADPQVLAEFLREKYNVSVTVKEK